MTPARRILIIDDDIIQDGPLGAVYARSSQEAIYRMTECTWWDQVYFDHDLGGSDTSMKVLEWLELQIHEGHPVQIDSAYIHSMNPSGSEALYTGLKRLYPTRRIPLPWKRKQVGS